MSLRSRHAIWRIAVDAPAYAADDMSGEGAKRSGGRWNLVGTRMVYAASSIGLACLETFVHTKSGGLPFNRYLVRIDIPDDLWAAAPRVDHASAPVGWDAIPTGNVSITLGENWIKSGASALLFVPSVIVQEESNILINPAHKDTAKLSATKVRKWLYDPRML